MHSQLNKSELIGQSIREKHTMDLELMLDGLPEPCPLRIIQPSMIAYSRHGTSDEIKFFDDHITAVQNWSSSCFLDTERIVYIIHGFRTRPTEAWIVEMTDALLRERDQTVVVLDWSHGGDVQFWFYARAAANVQMASCWLSKYLKEIARIRPNLYQWAIGHSLGAHLAGIAGRQSKALSRITGLDPAGPVFELTNRDKRLQPTDARIMVDVIHTDGFNKRYLESPKTWMPVNHFGTLDPLGTHDFYPNFGTSYQPGASFLIGSHNRAFELFIWSIKNKKKFRTKAVLDGVPAYLKPVTTACVIEEEFEMGYWADSNPSNASKYLFVLPTNSKAPWLPLVGQMPPPVRCFRE